MKVRRATPEDAATISALNDTVQRLHADAYPRLFKPPSADTFSAAEVAALLERPEHVILMAETDAIPVGYLYLQVVHRPESLIRHALDLVYIHHISVDDAYQGQGVGSALIAAARDLAREEDITHLELDVWSFNDRALHFFEHQGFTVYNQRLWMDQGDR
jgi:ribosomal protein S18 acetylase RimI-like enzyme